MDRGGRAGLLRLAVVLLLSAVTCVIVAAEGRTPALPVAGPTPGSPTSVSASVPDTLARYSGVAWPTGTVLVTDPLGTSLWALDPDGSKLRRVLGPGHPMTFTIGPSGTPVAGRVYLVDHYTGEVSVLNPDGKRRPIALLGGSPGDATVLTMPDGAVLGVVQHDTSVVEMIHLSSGEIIRGITLGSNPIGVVASTTTVGELAGYVLSQGDGVTQPGSVMTINRSASQKTTVGMNPCCSAIGPAGSAAAGMLYVPAADGSLTVIRSEGTASVVKAGLRSPTSVAVAPGSSTDGRVFVTDADGLHVFQFDGTPVTLIDRVTSPTTVAVAPTDTPLAGTVYVGSASGPLSLVRPGAAPVALSGAAGAGAIAIAPAGAPEPGTVYAASITDRTVSVIAADGQHIRNVRVGMQPSRLFVIQGA